MACRGHYAKRSDLTAYGTSKLMTIMAHTEMTQRLKDTGLESFICQPGMTSTPVYKKTDKSQVLANVLDAAQKVMGQTEDRGAIPLMYAATAPELAGTTCNFACWSLKSCLYTKSMRIWAKSSNSCSSQAFAASKKYCMQM